MQNMQLILIIIHCLMVTILSNAMDYANTFNLNAIEEITVVKDPWQIRYVSNKNLAIIGKNGVCNIFDLKNKLSRSIETRNHRSTAFPILERKNNKIIFAYDTRVIIYDEEKNQKVWDISNLPTVNSVALYPLKNILFLCEVENSTVIKKYNYISKECENIPILDHCHKIRIHPQKEIICTIDYYRKISLRKLDNIAVELKTIFLPLCFFCEYNLDGSRIIAGNKQKLYVIDPDADTTLFSAIIAPKNKSFDSIGFHPNGLVLATLAAPLSSSEENLWVIYYWNLKTQQLIDVTSVLLPGIASDICFSDDGLEVVVALKDKCIRTLVPFAVKEKCSYLLFVLNQLKEQNNLSKDIVKYCMHFLLKHVCL